MVILSFYKLLLAVYYEINYNLSYHIIITLQDGIIMVIKRFGRFLFDC